MEQGVMPCVWTVMLTIQFTQDEIMPKTRLSQISSYLFRSGRVFLILTFTGWRYWSGRPIMDDSGVGLFLVSLVAPLSMGRPEKRDFFWMFCQRIGAMCHDLISRKSRRFTWPRNMPRVSFSFVCVVSDVKAHCLEIVDFHHYLSHFWNFLLQSLSS